MGEKLTLIGTLHKDLMGYERLEKVLGDLKPKNLTVEYDSTVSIDQAVDKIAGEIDKRYEILEGFCFDKRFEDFYKSMIDTHRFETRASIDYADVSGADLHFVDQGPYGRFDSGDEKKDYNHILETGRYGLVSGKGMEDFDPDEERELFQKRINESYKSVQKSNELRYAVAKSMPNTFQETAMDFSTREDIMTQNIKNLNPDLHVGGIAHLYEEYAENHDFVPLGVRFGDVEKMSLYEAVNK